MELIERVLAFLHERKKNLASGNVNCIPSPLVEFRSQFPGIERGQYILVSGNTKSGKTQFSSYMFIFEPLLYAFAHQDIIRIKIFYAPLEETPETITMRFMSYLLYVLSGQKIRVSPKELQSTMKEIPDEVLNLLESDAYQERLKFFQEHIEWVGSTNPTGIYKQVMTYISAHGTRVMKKGKVTDPVTKEVHEVNVFDHYEPNDPHEYVFVYTDHISLLSPEAGMDLRNTIIKFSSYMVELRNRYKITPIVIQQQSTETSGLEAFKLNRLRPNIAGLSDSKYCARDCNIMFGIFNPYAFEKADYVGYNILRLKDCQRFLEVVINRDGESNGLKALYFDGAVSYFNELPAPDDPEMERYYRWIESTRLKKPVKTSMMIFGKLINNMRRNQRKITNFDSSQEEYNIYL